MIPEPTLRDIEALARLGVPASVHPETLRQLIAAARVANAAARAEQAERDAALSDRTGGDAVLSRLARDDLARALRHYTAPRPVEVPR